jgi:SAM-dependent methyltransferase
MREWIYENLVCPRDHEQLTVDSNALQCANGHRYPIVRDIPVMLVDANEHTLWVGAASFRAAREPLREADDYFVDTLGATADERIEMERETRGLSDMLIDPVVRFMVRNTNGNLYRSLIGRLPEYPIPELPLPLANGKTLLDVGCGWGRWCVAAAKKGYKPVGVDSSLGAALAAKRVSAQLGVDARFIVADGRYLPFRGGLFDEVFSYSVLQHFSRPNADLALSEIRRVLKPEGCSTIQMPNLFGIRCLYHQARRGFRQACDFEVRYSPPTYLLQQFKELIGPTELAVDGYFGLGIQASDRRLMPQKYRWVIDCSESLKRFSKVFGPIKYIADSLYLRSCRVDVSNG